LLELKERKIRYMQEYLVTRIYLEDVYHSGKLNAKTNHAFRGFIKGLMINETGLMLNNIPDLYCLSSLHLHRCMCHYVVLLTETK